MKFLLSTLITVFFLSSCSQQRYATVSKVKQNKTVEAEVASNVRMNSSSVQIKPSSEFDIKMSENPSIEPLEVHEVVKAEKAVTPEFSVKKAIKKFVINPIASIPLHPQYEPTQLSERKTQLNQDNLSETQAARGWFYYIVVGLIFFLLAGLFYNTLAGTIFGLVGLIAIIYGLLALIDIV